MDNSEKNNKLCNRLKGILLLVLLATVIYFLIYACFYGDGILSTGKELQKSDWLSFLGAYLSFVGTISVSIMALVQGEEYNRRENERRKIERIEMIQPIFSIDFEVNVHIPGATEILGHDFKPPKHNNVIYTIENVGAYPVSRLIIFDKYRKNLFKSNEKLEFACAYFDSDDAKEYKKLVTVLSDEYERNDDIPTSIEIKYEDIDGNKMIQIFKLENLDGKYFYSLMTRKTYKEKELYFDEKCDWL